MSTNVEVREGDRVRVVLEGEATLREGRQAFALGEYHGNIIYQNEEHVVSVEVLERKVVRPKVGDYVSGQDQYNDPDMPVGTILAGYQSKLPYLVRVPNAWVSLRDGMSYSIPNGNLFDSRTVLFVPEA